MDIRQFDFDDIVRFGSGLYKIVSITIDDYGRFYYNLAPEGFSTQPIFTNVAQDKLKLAY